MLWLKVAAHIRTGRGHPAGPHLMAISVNGYGTAVENRVREESNPSLVLISEPMLAIDTRLPQNNRPLAE